MLSCHWHVNRSGQPAGKLDSMGLDIIIVNFRSAPLMGNTVALAREFLGGDARLIVVDNSPGDGAAEIVRSADPDATVITNAANRGYAAAVNQAVAVAESEFVLLLNPDVRGISGRYADVLEAFRDPRVGAVVIRLLNTDGTLQQNCICAPRPFDMISEDLALAARFPNWRRPHRYRMLDWDHSEARPVDAARGACLFIRRAAFTDVGLFDARFFVYYEETDWLIRAKRRGWRTMFLPTVEAVHASAGSSPDAGSPHDLLLLESQHRYARKHFGPTTSALLRATQLGIDTARLARYALAGRAEAKAAAADRIRVHLTMRAPRPS
jgi:N-acetylglucosaminyl-diphospho-decaprenol L-rhamnosyltransferase